MLKNIEIAKKECDSFMKEHASSEYSGLVQKFCIPFINDAIAAKSMYVGKGYAKNFNYSGAIERFLSVLDGEKNIFQPEALYRLIESYFSLGLNEGLHSKLQQYATKINCCESDFWYIKAQKLVETPILRKSKFSKK